VLAEVRLGSPCQGKIEVSRGWTNKERQLITVLKTEDAGGQCFAETQIGIFRLCDRSVHGLYLPFPQWRVSTSNVMAPF
jgi:hypothetical protein